ncbi:unnamed protein product [Adineta steineri]|uniref:glutathione transferase n=1 Tax=Adineta steineri TaxID=433720 RepID=A0A819L3W6_9BILA|nr:unnamed protein product [Adineta steineri]CAF3958724.1 unnamed protein product [Adineta steineri]
MGGTASHLTRRATVPAPNDIETSKGNIIVHGLVLSTNTQRVLVTLAEKGLKYELKPLKIMESEQKSRQYVEGMQPFGLFPVLIDTDGFKIYESRAICRYLEEKYKGKGTELIPSKDIQARAFFEQAANIEAFNFDPPANALIRETVVKKIFYQKEPDPIKVAQYREDLGSKLNVYENILSKQPYLAGQVYTMADLFHLPCAQFIIKFGDGDLFESRPNVKQWWERISSRPSWKAVQEMK